ncbi:MAG: hypothetical protein KO253_03775 [Methanobrevibacter arboriphilus]|nr:hypothetical protein [Methanobrevibacter arboriphilus]
MIPEVVISADNNFNIQIRIIIISFLETNQEYFDKINLYMLNSKIYKKYEKLAKNEVL